MRCREAKRRLNSSAELDDELRAHLQTCESCSLKAAATRRLDVIFDQNRGREEEPPSPLSEIRERIDSILDGERKESSIMSKVKNQVNRHPGLGFSLAIAIFVFAMAVLIPFSYEKTVGYTVVYQGLDPAYEPAEGLLNRALASMGYDRATVDIEHRGTSFDCEIGNLSSKSAAREAAATFTAISGYDGVATILPVKKEISASLYAQVKDKLNRIEIDTKGKADSEVKSEIELRLKESGFDNYIVKVTTKEDGMREISVGISDSSDTSMSKRQFEIMSSDGEISFGGEERISIDSEDMTDEEITAEIKRQLGEKGVEDADISVKTDQEGKRNIEIKIEKEEED